MSALTTSPCWKINFSQIIQQRNEEESKPFQSLVQQYENLCNELRKTKKLHQTTKEKLNSIQVEYEHYKEEYSKLKTTNSPGVPSPSGVSSARVKELEEKVYCLQEELTSAFRAKVESAQSLLDLNNEVKRLKSQEQDQKLQYEKLVIELENLKESNRGLEEKLQKKESAIELLKSERDTLLSELREKDKQVEQLTEENKKMVERVVDQKQKQVDAMNQVNELYKSFMQQKQQLQLLQAKYKTGSVDLTGVDVVGTVSSPNPEERPEKKNENSFFSFLDKIRNVGNTSQNASSSNNLPISMNISTSSSSSNDQTKILITPPKTIVSKQTIDTQINGVDFSDDTHSVAIACSDKTIRIFNSKSGSFTNVLHGSTDSVIKVKFSLVGQLALGACADSICRIWNLGNDRVKHTLTGHTKKIYGADFSPDAKKVVTGAHDRTIKFWELQFGTCEKTLLTCKSSVNDVEVSRGGDVVASAHFDSAIRLWDMRTYKSIAEIERAHDGQQVTSVSFSKDGTKLLSNGKDNLLNIYDTRMSNKVLDTLKHSDYKNTIVYNKACFSPCGEYCAAGGTNGKIFIWSLTPTSTKAMGSSCLVANGHSTSATGVVWNPDGSQIASCGLDKTLLIYE
ncbi:hypothetical protein C9374_013284 [Naegleria lovaniensis]|uniref:Autophagy-related protein 16 domain-containing protein n=1 Tax=Naegleria lovaniensis TaxID=51637 RepID=A0AA88GWG6_NAELO|nr:uncharacterized protein C9374_013284 [Naegleria lovaniensis]KAG2391799.1 hypothetical protein C9374_013284 [Naegleria lovaniensis]